MEWPHQGAPHAAPRAPAAGQTHGQHPHSPRGVPLGVGPACVSSSALITPHPEAVAPQHPSPLRTEQGARQGLERSLPGPPVGCVCRRQRARAGAGPVLQHLCLPRAAQGCRRFTSFAASSIPPCHGAPRGEPGWPSCSRRGSAMAPRCAAVLTSTAAATALLDRQAAFSTLNSARTLIKPTKGLPCRPVFGHFHQVLEALW